MDIGYIQEKLYGAVYSLVGNGHLKERLGGAYINLAYIPEEQIPEDIRKEFNHVMQLVRTNKADTKEGKIKSAVSKMNNSVRYDMAKIILGMYGTVTRQLKSNSIE